MFRSLSLKKIVVVLFLTISLACKQKENAGALNVPMNEQPEIKHAKGFSIERTVSGITIVKISSPWPKAETSFTYALVPRALVSSISLDKEVFDAIILVPVNSIVVTSTTHIPALEALGVEDRLVGFPDTQYISSEKTRKRITDGLVKELGNNEAMNTEMVIELRPDLVVGFSINNQNRVYETLQHSNIRVVYNGDWTEETPLGKAEWIKFFAPFFGKETAAKGIFDSIEKSYLATRDLARTATSTPTVLSGALYKDIWYLPGGKSWAAQFLADANAKYLWANTEETGSLSLSWESILDTAQHADFWVGPAQFTSYNDLQDANTHYTQFDAFKNKHAYTFAKTTGATGGLLYYELAPHRPDIVLKDLIHILHPELLPDHQLYFFKPLD